MADISGKIDAIFKLVEEGDYFVINRPRQYGKTTTLYLLERRLQQQLDYFPVFISFEGFGTESYKNEQNFIEAFFSKLRAVFRFYKRNDLLPLLDNGQAITTLNRLDEWISELTNVANQRLVLMIDEVDKSSNNQLFLDFLGLLRTKYLLAVQGKDLTFHSVILAGVHDVKSLKLKIRPDEERKYNSPWNIAVDFTVDLSLTPHEIQTMLQEYSATTGVQMDFMQIAARLHYFTSGYPFLVSKLCKIMDEDFLQPTPSPQCHQLKEWIEAIPFALSLSKGLSRDSTGSPRTAYIA
jgi:hypothetical protein